MTNPTPPGWHSDPAGSGKLRWWDGTEWTEHYADPTPTIPAYATGPQTTVGNTYGPAGPPQPPAKTPFSRGTKIALGVGAVVVVLFAIAAIAGGGPDEDSTTAAASTTRTTTTTAALPVTTPPTAPPAVTTTAPAAPRTKTTTPKPAGCQQAPPEYLDVINSSFLNGYQLTDVSAFSVGETWYIAGEITQDGKVRSRDDLFAAQDLVITPVTATARIESTLPDLRKVLDVNFLDDGAQKALNCARTY